jgi:hypothetical protein
MTKYNLIQILQLAVLPVMVGGDTGNNCKKVQQFEISTE